MTTNTEGLREQIARLIGSFVVYDDKGGPDTEVLADVIGGDYDEATRRVYALADAIISGPLQEQLKGSSGAGDVEPIDTAPRDGRWMIGWRMNLRPFPTRWHPYSAPGGQGPGWWGGEPTHWLPFPTEQLFEEAAK
jgi:hypothetical protein